VRNIKKGGWFCVMVLALLVINCIMSVALAQQVTIEYWDQHDPKLDTPRSRAMADEIRRFEEANPNIKIVNRVLAWHQFVPQLIQAAGSNQTPCVSTILLLDLPQVAKAGVTASLDEFSARWPGSVKNDFLLGWDVGVFDGKKMAFAKDYRVFVLWYRKDLLSAAGFQVPKTVDELIQTARALNKGDIHGMVVGLSRAGNAQAFMEWFIPMLWAGGGDLLNERGEPAFTGEAGVRAVQVLADLVNKQGMSREVIADTYETVTDRFKAGRIAMLGLGSHRVVTVREGGKFGGNLQTAWLPGYAPDKPAPAHAMGYSLMMGKDCKHREEAWKFIEHMLSPEIQLRHVQMTGEMPTRRSPYNDTWFSAEQAKEIRFWMEYMAKHGRLQKYSVRHVELSQLLDDAVQEVILRSARPEDALRKAAERYKELGR